MSGLLTFLVVVFGGAGALLKLLESWLRDDGKKKLAEILEVRWLQVADSDPVTIVRAPIVAARALLDVFLGSAIFSRKAFYRTSVLSTILLAASLGAAGIFGEEPLGGALPWRLFDKNVELARSLAHKPEKSPTTGPVEVNEVMARQDRMYDSLLNYTSGRCKILFCLMLPIAVLLISSVLDFMCMAILRQLLRELVDAKGYMTILAGLGFNLFLAAVTSFVALLLITAAAFPVFCPTLVTAVGVSRSSVFMAAILLLGFGALVWFVASAALRIIALVAVVPTVLVLLSLIFTAVAFPFRRRIHQAVTAVLLRAAESGKSALGFAAIILGSLAALVGILAKILG